MNILNQHSRIIARPKAALLELFSKLATPDDPIWPKAQWPAIRFKGGLKVGASGGHGPIRYQVVDYDPAGKVTFQFQKPKGFDGAHQFELLEISPESTELRHTITMQTNLKGTIIWGVAIRWLHDALLEDALDKVENTLMHTNKRTPWSLWVKFLRKILR